MIQLPSGMDPDEYIGKYGNEAFLNFVAKDKKAFVLFKVESHQDEINNNDLAYERHFREATHDIAQVQSTILRNKLIQDVANIFNMSPEMIYHEVGSKNMPQVAPAEYGYSPQSGSQLFNNLTKHEKAERALLKHFMKDKDTFINYYQKISDEDFTNKYFKSIFNILHDYFSEHDNYSISDVMQYIDSNELREAFIELEQYTLNDEPYENEIEDYILIINNNDDESIESLNHKLREASRIGDVELQKYYLQLIVDKNKNRM